MSAERPGVVAARAGMFGVDGPGDTSGYGRLRHTVRQPEGSPRPYGGWFDEVAGDLANALAERGVSLTAAVPRTVVDRGELTFVVRRERLLQVVMALRDVPALRFELCCSVSGVHFPQDEGAELHVAYHLLSITHNRRLRLEVSCPDSDPHIPSIVPVYPTADWHERETYDFFGIVFDGHPGLTRIQLPDDWDGHPQRKDYPLGGIPVEYPGVSVPPPDERRSYR